MSPKSLGQVTSRSSEIGSHEEPFAPLIIKNTTSHEFETISLS